MERSLRVRHSVSHSRPRANAVWLSVLMALVFSIPAFGQQIPVTGTVTNAAGMALRGVSVHVQGTTTRVLTDANGKGE